VEVVEVVIVVVVVCVVLFYTNGGKHYMIQIIEQLRLGRPYNQLHGSVQKYTTAVQTYTRSNEQQRKKNMGNTKFKRLVVNKTSQKKITRTI